MCCDVVVIIVLIVVGCFVADGVVCVDAVDDVVYADRVIITCYDVHVGCGIDDIIVDDVMIGTVVFVVVLLLMYVWLLVLLFVLPLMMLL